MCRRRVHPTPAEHPRPTQVHAALVDGAHAHRLLPVRVGAARDDSRPDAILRHVGVDRRVRVRVESALHVPDLSRRLSPTIYIPQYTVVHVELRYHVDTVIVVLQ